jgi:DNA-binding MarR family transcriptional regulator
MKNLTELEMKIVAAIKQSELYEETNGDIWVDVEELSDISKLSKGSVKGVLGSLRKKGVITITPWEDGLNALNLHDDYKDV